MKATKIKMKNQCEYSGNVCDIDSIYLDAMCSYYKNLGDILAEIVDLRKEVVS